MCENLCHDIFVSIALALVDWNIAFAGTFMRHLLAIKVLLSALCDRTKGDRSLCSIPPFTEHRRIRPCNPDERNINRTGNRFCLAIYIHIAPSLARLEFHSLCSIRLGLPILITREKWANADRKEKEIDRKRGARIWIFQYLWLHGGSSSDNLSPSIMFSSFPKDMNIINAKTGLCVTRCLLSSVSIAVNLPSVCATGRTTSMLIAGQSVISHRTD